MTADSRHKWFVEFEQDFKRQCTLLAQVRAVPLEYRATEADWSAWAGYPHGGPNWTITLPHNYALFRPLSVALNVATRLFDMAGTDAPAAHRRPTPR